jgi:aminomethyltransferase
LVSRTGYTGEDGFEIYLKPKDAEAMWRLLLARGKNLGVASCGLGSRDTLRLEASLPLYGHELSMAITPLEAGLGRFVNMEKTDFIGKSALQADVKRTLVGLKVTGRGIIREHMQIFAGEREIGFSTSGTHCPFLGAPYAMALVDKDYFALKTPVEADVRGRRVTAEVTPLPFYRR